MTPRISLLVLAAVAGCSGEAEDERRDGLPSAVGLTARALPARSGGSQRFRLRSPEETGVTFRHELRRENVVPYVYSGSGLTVGDYDGDGLPDLYLVSQDGPNRLYRQVAPFRFEDVTASAGGLDGGEAWGSAASFIDYDGDTDLDLYVCNLEAPNLLFENQGDGTFRECAREKGLDLVAATTGVAFADYDHDGDLDVYLLTNRVFGPRLPYELVAETTLPADTRRTRRELHPPRPRFEERDGALVVPPGFEDFYFVLDGHVFVAGQRDRLMRNDGAQGFTDVTTASGIADQGNGLSVLWWDLDGDGWQDLYVANDLESPDRLYHNQGDGTFAEISRDALPYTPYFAMGSDFGDVDNDGAFDLCVADMSSTTHYMSKMLMGSMDDKRWFLMNAEPPQLMRNMLFVGTGTGRFLETAPMAGLSSTDWTWTVRLADFDEDMRQDLFATNGIPLFEDDPDATARFTELWRSGQREAALDLARHIPFVAEKNIARRNVGDLRFEDVSAEWGLDAAGVSYGSVAADLDRDGDLDLVVLNMNDTASIYENQTSGTHRILVELVGVATNRRGLGARIEVETGGVVQTRLVTATRGYMSSGEAIEAIGLGAATRIDRLTVRWPSGRVQEYSDLPADHSYTITEGDLPAPRPVVDETIVPWFEASTAPGALHAEADFDDYAVQPLLPHRLSRLGPGLALGDVNGDGRDDVYIGGARGQVGSLHLARGDGEAFHLAEGPFAGDLEHEDLGAVFLDFDGDEDLDLYVVSGSIEHGAEDAALEDRLYVNDGTGRFARAEASVLPDIRRSGSCVAAADFDRDGDVDLFVGVRVAPGRYPNSASSVLLRNDGGRFVDATDEVAPSLANAGMVSGACWIDADGDGWLDLALAAEAAPLRLLSNREGARLEDFSEASGMAAQRGLWNGIAAADLDADGDLDLVVTNLGLNTKYKADAAHPFRLYAADFDEDGELDVVESKEAEGAELPVRGRSCSSAAMPFLAEKFQTYDSFARATLPEIYGIEALEASLRLEVDELRTVVLENQGGRFVARPLPRLAQVSPGFGIAIEDFDGDGHLDIVLAQNSFSPEPETGRFGGGLGLVLAGRGDLSFLPLSVADAGFVVPEDAQALAIADLDGNGAPDLLLTTNDGPVRAFRARRHGARLAVRLRGPAGNPTGVGATVTLTGPDGRVQHRTIGAGSGYLGQSAPVAFFAVGEGEHRVDVRWPDGTVSGQGWSDGGGSLTIGR
jgi:hypothetical protein